MVPFHAVDGGVDDFELGGVEFGGAGADAIDGEGAGGGIADDAAFADVEASGLELGLDEEDGGAVPGRERRAEGVEDGGKDEGGGDERDVHGEEGRGGGAGEEKLTVGEEAGVGALAEIDAGIVAELLGDLAVAGVDGEDGLGAVREHAVGEAAGGGSDVDAGEVREVDAPVLERMFELEGTAADVFEVGAEEANGGVAGDGGAWLVDALLIDEDAAGEDEGLGAFAGGGVTEVDEELVEANFHGTVISGVGTLYRLHGRGERVSGRETRSSFRIEWCRQVIRRSDRQYGCGGCPGISFFGLNAICPGFRCVFMYRETGVVNTPPLSTLDDAALLLMVQRGDEYAMASLFDRYSKVVYSVALRVLRDPASAEDVLQEIFMQVWRNPNGFIATRGSLGGWLAVVSRNRSIDTLRRKRPTDQVDDMALASPYNLSDEAERNNLMEKARKVIHTLPTEQRKTLEMAFFDGLTHSEIAEMTGDPLGTVKTRIRSAMMTLRKAFKA